MTLVAGNSAYWRVDFLRDVRDGRAVTAAQVAAFVAGAADGTLPDYQLSAFLMAVLCRGFDDASTSALTLAMRDSGAVLAWPPSSRRKVDKHSTGGVGDKISLHLAPWMAACGLDVPMVAGRGLGHTGGTLDKLDSIPGFRHALSLDAFRQQVEREGVAIMGQSAQFAPADKKLYGLRDVTATVESIPLITASILAKKLAEGLDALVLDVKVGAGAFMKDLAAARSLARSIVAVGRHAGLRVRARLTDMQAPLGRAVGNALEVRESLEVLEGRGPADTVALTYALGADMLELAGVVGSADEGRTKMRAALASGDAYERFCRMVAAQGGDVAALAEGGRGLPRAPEQTAVRAPRTGTVAGLSAYPIGHACVALGAGRARADDAVDGAVGVVIDAPVGTSVRAGEPVLTVHHRGPVPAGVVADLQASIRIVDGPMAPPPLLLDVVADGA